MNREEYFHLRDVEQAHWYYAGKRNLVRRHILRHVAPDPAKLLVDLGPGTGLFADEMRRHFAVRAVDTSPVALELLREHLPHECIIQASGERMPFDDASVDVLTALDVLEHIEHDAQAVAEIHRILKPGGWVLATVPAMMCLWSDWDVKLHHYRRYTRTGFAGLFGETLWCRAFAHYINWPVFPAVYAVRKLLPRGGAGGSEHKIPPACLNTPLRWVFEASARWPLPVPFGVSVLVVAQKR